jgi:hypothetical protein
MNKLFTKVAALTLGVAMAAGVCVAVGASQKASSVFADSVTLTPADFANSWTGSQAAQSGSSQGFTLATTSGMYTKEHLRQYSGATLTLSSTVGKMTQVVFTCTANGTSNYGPGKMSGTGYTASTGKTGTWTGNADSFSLSGGQSRITSIAITYTISSEPGLFADVSSLWLVDEGSSKDVALTVSNFSSTPTLAVSSTPSYVNVAFSENKATFSPKAIGSETVRITATSGDQSAYVDIAVAVYEKHGLVADDPFTVTEAAAAVTAGGPLEQVYVSGKISQVETPSSFSGSLCYYISNDGTTSNHMQVRWGKGLNNESFSSVDAISVGDSVVVHGDMESYSGAPQIKNGNYLVSYTPAGPSLTSVEIGGSASATAGKAWDYSGVTVTAHYDDQSTKDIKEFCTIVIEDAAVESMQTATVKVTYQGVDYTETINVTVNPPAAAKDFQKITSTSELADGKYLIVFEDSDSETPAPFTFDSSLETLDAVSNTVSVTVADSKINISEDEAFEIKEGADGYTIKSSSGYYIGQTSDANGLQASKTVEYKNSITFDDNGNANISSSGAFLRYNSTSGQTRFRYYKSASYTAQKPIALYKVYEAPAPTLESIAVSGEYKTKYAYQENFDEEGIVVTATYSDQSQQPVDLKDVEFSGYDKSVLGKQTVTVTYQEKTTTFKVTVYYTATYKPGEGTSEKGEYVEYIENPDNYELVAFEKTGFVAPTGKQFKEWSQGTTGKSVQANGNLSFTAVYEDIPAQKFTITYKAGYGTGEDVVIDVEAGSLHALVTFETAGFTAPEGQQFKGWQVDNDAELHAAGYEVTVNNHVTVTAIYEDIPATDWSETFKSTFQSRFKTTYLPPFVNAEFAKESNQKWHSTYPYCKIEVEGNFYSNAATLFNNDSNWHFLGYDEYDCPIFMSHDQKAFVIIDAYMKVQDGPVYTSLTFECVGDYAVVTTDAKTEYYVGDNLDLTNVKLCAKLLDGTIVENLTIPQAYWSVSPTTLTEAGDEVVITITVAALEEEFTYNVKVTPVVMESISISGELSKTEYTEGDAWDATGLVATAHYNNGAEEDVTAQVSWTFQPEETVAGTNSVSVVATLDEISSEAANFDVVVKEPAPVYDADTFAKDLLEMVAPICAKYDGKKNNKAALKTVWDTMSQRYSTLSNEEKAKVIAAAAKTDGTDLEKAMAFYNYACKKYGLTKFIEGRQVKALVAEHETGNSILPIVVIVASSVAAITAIGVVIALKRRKALLAK